MSVWFHLIGTLQGPDEDVRKLKEEIAGQASVRAGFHMWQGQECVT